MSSGVNLGGITSPSAVSVDSFTQIRADAFIASRIDMQLIIGMLEFDVDAQLEMSTHLGILGCGGAYNIFGCDRVHGQPGELLRMKGATRIVMNLIALVYIEMYTTIKMVYSVLNIHIVDLKPLKHIDFTLQWKSGIT